MRLTTLGGLELAGSTLRRPKPLLLLAYLAIEGRRDRRHLADVFWPAATDARNRLSVTLRRLRAEAPGSVEADSTHVTALVACDAIALRDALARGDVDAARALHRGAFLAGFELELGPELEEWLYATREAFADGVRDALIARAATLADHGDAERAAALAEVAATLPGATPLEPDAAAELGALLQAGDRDRSLVLRRSVPDAVATAAWPAPTRALAARPAAILVDRRTSFVGRGSELSGIADLFDRVGARLVTIHGPGGAGKTRLALEAARDRADAQGATQVHTLSLLPVGATTDLLPVIADAIGAARAPGDDPFQAVAAALRGRPTWLVLDEAEHVVDAAPILDALLDECPELRLLVTSRRRLHLQREHVWRLDGLAVPDAAAADLALATGDTAALADGDAVRLFLQRARQARADLAWAPSDVHAAWRVCRAVDGLPLAIELAAVWVRAMPVAAIEAAIASSIDALATPARDVAPHHRTMRAVLERSWSLLDDRERRVLERLAVFEDGFDVAAAVAVADADATVLAMLVDAALVDVATSGRFHTHALPRQFALERLARDPAHRVDVERAHLAAMRQLAARAAPHLAGPEQVAWFERLDADLANLRAALGYGERHAPAEAIRLAYDLDHFWTVRRRQREVAATMRRIAAQPALAAPEAARAQALYLIASAEHDEPAAEAPAAEALAIARTVDDAHLVARATLFWGTLAQRLLRTVEAERAITDALARFRAIGDASGEAAALKELGTVFYRRGDDPTAETWWRASLEVEATIGNHWGVASRTYNLGLIAKRRGDLDVARSLQRRALHLNHRLGDPLACVHGVEALACVASVAGRPLRAARLWGAVEAEREVRGLERLPDARAAFLEDTAEARTQVDAARFASAWARGRRDGFAAVVAEELRRAPTPDGTGAAARSAAQP
jgi:predicted ATPase